MLLQRGKAEDADEAGCTLQGKFQHSWCVTGLCSHRAVFLHFLQRKLLNSLYLMPNGTTGTETPAPSFPRGRERREQQAQERDGGSWVPSLAGQELQTPRSGLPMVALPCSQPAAPTAPRCGGDHAPTAIHEDRSHQLPPLVGLTSSLKLLETNLQLHHGPSASSPHRTPDCFGLKGP